MSLTGEENGLGAVNIDRMKTKKGREAVIALAGNPNVGKSTVFNALTGLNQHTGNWAGKTVSIARGRYTHNGREYVLVDLPGTYSILSHSREEEVARDYICFGGADGVIVVCDASCLERNLNLVLQILEVTPRVIVCVNLMDEAERKGIFNNLKLLQKILGVPVVGTAARKGTGLDNLMNAVESLESNSPFMVKYDEVIEKAVRIIEESIKDKEILPNHRFAALRVLSGEEFILRGIKDNTDIHKAIVEANKLLEENGIEDVGDRIVTTIIKEAETIAEQIHKRDGKKDALEHRIDKIITGKYTGIPIMLVLLCLIFWITINGANYPSALLSKGLFYIQDRLTELFTYLGAPGWLHSLLVLGVYRVVAWIVSVMLPPMAIFFPLFTLLEDLGYLPRIAFNMDNCFKKACACGKQSLTMCMGFGCNAAGVVGCRIIDSPRERLIAVLTNNFVPCNGRFPTLIALISMFALVGSGGFFGSVLKAGLLCCVILFGVFMTLLVSKILSKTLLKGVPSSFTLELPPYRKPQIGRILIRSLLDRTIFVLGRAVVVAIPAGLIIWLSANISVDGISILKHCADFLDPFASLFGLDGVILIAFILGSPANEIVIPIMIMAYTSTNTINDFTSLSQLRTLLVDNGWSWVTALSVMIFSICHWPCLTTMLTIKKETGSFKWTLLSFLLPTVSGLLLCLIFSNAVNLLI